MRAVRCARAQVYPRTGLRSSCHSAPTPESRRPRLAAHLLPEQVWSYPLPSAANPRPVCRRNSPRGGRPHRKLRTGRRCAPPKKERMPPSGTGTVDEIGERKPVEVGAAGEAAQRSLDSAMLPPNSATSHRGSVSAPGLTTWSLPSFLRRNSTSLENLSWPSTCKMAGNGVCRRPRACPLSVATAPTFAPPFKIPSPGTLTLACFSTGASPVCLNRITTAT